MNAHRVLLATLAVRLLVLTVASAVVVFPAPLASARQGTSSAPPAPLPEIDESHTRHATKPGAEREAARPEGLKGLPFFSSPPPSAAQGGNADIDAVAEEQRYRDCLALAGHDPDTAFDRAFRWKTDGGGLPADHCIAVALIAIGRPAVAADRFREMLEELKRGRGLPPDPLGGPPSIDLLAAQIYDQMGNAWLLADDPLQAIDAFDRALTILPAGYVQHELELYLDRARADGLAHAYEDAVKDLDRAEAIDPERAEIFLLRASAERALERYDDAARDITRALELRTEWPDALLERANLNAMRGRPEEARKDWLKIATRWPEHPAAEAARANLARLDGSADESIGRDDAAKGPAAVQPSGTTSVELPAAPMAARHSSRTAGSGSDLP